MPRNFFDDLLDMRSLVSRFRARFFGSRGEGLGGLEDEVSTPAPPTQGRGPQRPGGAQAQRRPGPQRPGPSSQGPPQRPGVPPQFPSPPLAQNQRQTPPTPAESFADQQIEIAKARGKSYLDNAFSTWTSQLYSRARNYLERIFRP